MPIANTCSIGYPHDSRADYAAYRHDRRADNAAYRHDRRADSLSPMLHIDFDLACWLSAQRSSHANNADYRQKAVMEMFILTTTINLLLVL